MKLMNYGFILIMVSMSLLACTRSSSNSHSDLDSIPEVAPIVQAATPLALRAPTTAQLMFRRMRSPFLWIASEFSVSNALATEQSEGVLNSLRNIFLGEYGNLSGGTSVGYINSLLRDLDSRMNELKTRFSDQAVSCMSRSAQSLSIDLSSIFSGFTSSFEFQCQDLFNSPGDQSYAGSGMLFGHDAVTGDYSLWLDLNHSSSDGFGYAARVKNPTHEVDKEVDVMFVEASSQNSRGTVARLKAKPSAQSFELVYRSTSPSGIQPLSGGSSQSLGYALDLISDGSLIYVQGKYSSGASSCNDSTSFSLCLSASDLSIDTSTGACDSLAENFSIGSRDALVENYCPTIPNPTDGEKTLFNVIQISRGDVITARVSAQ